MMDNKIDGLGFSSTAEYYAIKSRKEAEDYLKDDLLRELNTPGLFEPSVRHLRATLPFRTEPSFR